MIPGVLLTPMLAFQPSGWRKVIQFIRSPGFRLEAWYPPTLVRLQAEGWEWMNQCAVGLLNHLGYAGLPCISIPNQSIRVPTISDGRNLFHFPTSSYSRLLAVISHTHGAFMSEGSTRLNLCCIWKDGSATISQCSWVWWCPSFPWFNCQRIIRASWHFAADFPELFPTIP